MAIGGFNGTDPSPTLAQFQQLVAAGDVHYFIAGGGCSAVPAVPAGRVARRPSTSSAITSWVTTNFNAKTVDGVTVYDLTAAREGN